MSFRFEALDPDHFSALFALSDDELQARGARRVIAGDDTGYPCRVSLCDADPGDTLLLVNHQHLDANSPYASRHAVYVREGVERARPAPGTVPAMLRSRLLSVRGFDAAAMMQSAEVIEGTQLGEHLGRVMDNPAIDFVDVHFAGAGCFGARARRPEPA